MLSSRLALVFLAGLALGSSAVMTRMGVMEFAPLTLVALRLLVGTVLFAGTLLVLRRTLPRRPRVLLAHVFLPDERLTATKGAGLLLALAGVLYLLGTRTTGLLESAKGADLRGDLMAVSGALSAAAAGVYTRRRLRGIDPVVLTGVQMAAGLVAVVLAAGLAGTFDVSRATWRGWFAVGYSGVIGSYVGFMLLFLMIQRYGATTAALPGYVTPVVAAIIGTLLLREVITVPLVAGAALVLSGVFLVSR